ncbi:uncharacterized protein [Amphiura filiformis]|uniref:uncharacterized protein isoform X2 n=1 Tax=Amphiura filiformis TaxID=82378 RepID=UPI003B226C98
MESNLTCSICLQLYGDPVALPCMHSFCRICLLEYCNSISRSSNDDRKVQTSCPNCKKLHSLSKNIIRSMQKNFQLQSIVESYRKQQGLNLPSPDCDMCNEKPAESRCSKCEVSYCLGCLNVCHPPTRPPFSTHSLVAIGKSATATTSGNGNAEAMEMSLSKDGLSRRSNEVVNSLGVPARKGTTGKYYCGRRVLSCYCCNGHCGPTNGCNCADCQKLDEVRLNYAGAPARKGTTGKYYCGRRVLSCLCCNGHCGPTNGCNCVDCQKLDIDDRREEVRFNSAGVPAKKGTTGKYYCGRRVLSCYCCNGHCGPTNGCNCMDCQKLDEVRFNSAGAPARKGTTGKYYCGRRVLSCFCCNGHCGPTNGCNCVDCQKLDNDERREVRFNSAGAPARKGTTGKYYCGRRVLSCFCCNGHCGPTNGCNCADCQKLD